MKKIPLLAIAFAFMQLKASAQDTALAKAYYERGKNLSYNFMSKNKDSVIIYYDLAIRENPKYAEAYYARATAYRKSQIEKDNIADLDKAILYGEKANYYFARSKTYEKAGDIKKSLSDVQYALKLKNDEKNYIKWRAFLFEENKQWKDALADYQTLNKMDERYWTTYDLARVFFEIKDFKNAKIYIDKAVETWSDKAGMFTPRDGGKPYLLRGKIYFATGKYKEAVDDYTKYWFYDMPNKTIECMKLRAEAYEKLGKKGEAAKDRAEFERLQAKGGR